LGIVFFQYSSIVIAITIGAFMTISNDHIEKIKELVKNNHKEHLGNDGYLKLFPDMTKSYEWENEANIERLCFNCGPSKSIKSENIKYETELKNVSLEVAGRADVILTNSKGFIATQKEKVFSITENKLAFDYIDVSKQIDEAVGQLNNYVKLFDASDEYSLNNDFFVSVCIFNPLIFLKKHEPYLNYLNDKYSSQEQKYQKYGLLILTIKVKKDGSYIYPNMLKNTKINILPTLIELKGNLNLKEHFLDKDNFTMSVKFLELSKLPLTNINPSSKINNPREYMEDAPENKTRRIKIFKTMESLYLEDKNTRSRSLGAKNREVAYDINETIMYNLPYKDKENNEDNQKKFLFKDILIIATTNISLIDGQHSTQAFFDLYNNKYGELSWSKHGEDNFKENMSEYFFGLNFKGYNKIELALNAAINQNNIAKQTRVDETLLEYRDYIIKLANFYNGKSEYILNFNKSSYSLEHMNNRIIIWAYYFTYIWGVLEEHNFTIETFKNTSNSKTTPSQSNGNNLRNSIDWVLEDERSKELIEISKIISKYNKKINSNTVDNIDEEQLQYNDEEEILNGLDEYIKNIDNLKIDSFPYDIKLVIYSLKRAFSKNKKEEINELIEELYKSLNEELKIKDILLDNIMLVLGEVKKIFNNDKTYKTKVVMVMWMLRFKYKYDKHNFENKLVNKQHILECFEIIKDKNLEDINKFENYIKQYF
jgi:hypothetical protein